MLTRTYTVLLEGLRNSSDRSAWEAFDARYRPLVMAVARRLGLQQADAEDVAQETMAAFVKAYRQDQYDRGKGRLRDWLCGIAWHKVADLRRKLARPERPVADKTDATHFLNQLPDDHVTAVWEDEYNKAVLRQCLQEARGEVAPRTFEAFELFALQQWPAKRVAAHLQISEDVVYQSKSRILARIRRLLPQMREIW